MQKMLQPRPPGRTWSSILVPALLACTVLYGGVLRLHALFETLGPYHQPAWLASAEPHVLRIAPFLTPPDWHWGNRTDKTYMGDPSTYLEFARAMRHFYQAHVREPMFVAATRLSLALTNDADVGVSLVSILFALLTIVAAFALGREMASPAAGLAAAAALAIDHTAVGWSIEGWRDEMFGFFVALFAWSWIRISRRPTYANAALAGAIGAAACLTRITALSFLAPAWLWFAAGGPTPAVPFERRMRTLAASMAVTVALVAPYLINCAIETGDPFYSINYHTQFYLSREGAADITPRNAALYAAAKFSHPIAAADTALRGLTVHPFTNKWVGLDPWYPGLGQTASWLALAGLFGWCWQPYGRLLLIMLTASLVPYMLTWNIQGGGEWRFTFHAYAFYLVAAFWFADRLLRSVGDIVRSKNAAWLRSLDRRRVLYQAGAFAIVVIASVSWAVLVPYFLIRESLVSGTTTTLMAGERERWLFAAGWSDPVTTGNVIARFTTEPVAEVRLPLPEDRDYDLVLRMDPLPYPDAQQQAVEVGINESPLGVFELKFDPNRIGEYRLRLPAASIRRGVNELTFRSAVMQPVGRAGAAYEELARDQMVGVRLWCVVIDPVDIMP